MARPKKVVMEEEAKGVSGKSAGIRKATNKRVEKSPIKPAGCRKSGNLPASRKGSLQQKVAKKQRANHSDNHDDDGHPEDDIIERDFLGFCCYKCRCPENKEDFMPASDDGGVHRYIQSCEGALYHRSCCHGIQELPGEDFATLYEAARERIGEDDDEDGNNYCQHSNVHSITREQIDKCYEMTKLEESNFYNADGDEHPDSRLFTNEDYVPSVIKRYQDRCTEVQKTKETNRRRAVVLDVFAGIGSAIVVLKRLGIDIAKVIHVEHDKVATHVYRWNHDRIYNPDLPEDGIEHVFVEKWEDFENNWELLCKEHGPIDIIVGAPPYSDLSTVNAAHKGFEGKQKEYLLSFGRRIREIERYQACHVMFFLVETMFVTGDDLTKVREAFELDWDPIALDSQYFSPTSRNRHFLTNIPLVSVDFTTEVSMKGPKSCLENGFVVGAHIVDPDVTAKCFMTSDSDIDDLTSLRMFVFKERCSLEEKSKNGYYGRPMEIIEREKLLGYPVGYIEVPVKALFSCLVEKAHSHTFQSDKRWKDCLEEKYHTFAGNYHALQCKNPHRFEFNKVEEPYVFLMLTPPSHLQSPVFFNAEGYAKHLIGMAYSVPVLEVLLKPLQQLYKSKTYDGFQYSYAWDMK